MPLGPSTLSRSKDYAEVDNYARQQHPPDCPRMPWHDIHCEWFGAIARDIARHFVHQWNHARIDTRQEHNVPELVHWDNLPITDHIDDNLGIRDVTTLELPATRGSKQLAAHAASAVALSAEKAFAASAATVSASAHAAMLAATTATPSSTGAEGAAAPTPAQTAEHEAQPASGSFAGHARGSVMEAATELASVPEDHSVGGDTAATLSEEEAEEEEASEAEQQEPMPPPPPLARSPAPVTPPRLTLNLKQPSSALVDLSEGGPEEEEEGARPAHASRLFRSASKATSVSEQFGPDLMTRGFAVDAQCVRSLGVWSGASPGEKDTSLMKAMIALITSAQRFIYIEK